jgi:thiol-disulfide isomerase/thioredoxin
MHLCRAAALVASLICFFGALVLLVQPGLPERAAFTGSISAGVVTAPEIGASAPLFRASLLDGSALDFASLRGKIIVLNFWATWCEPCEVEMPILQALQEQFSSDQLHIVAINTGEERTAIEAWALRLQLTLMIALDTDLEITSTYHIRGQPQTFVIDRQGVIRAIFFGATDDLRLRAAIEPLL